MPRAALCYHPGPMPRALRLLLAAAALLASPPAHAAAEKPLEPWKPPPRFAAIWLQGGAFFPSGLSGTKAREQVALGLALRPLPFASLFAEGGWITREFTQGGEGSRSLVSRGGVLGLRLHHAFGSLEPGLLAGVSIWRSELSAPVQLTGAAGARGETASSTGLVLGAALDWLVGDFMAVGLDWRWHRADARFPVQGAGAAATRLDLGGHAAGLALRLYWP